MSKYNTQVARTKRWLKNNALTRCVLVIKENDREWIKENVGKGKRFETNAALISAAVNELKTNR